jgi:hypothetical protein
MKRIVLLFCCFLIWTTTNTILPANATIEITEHWNGVISIEARDSFLVEIVKELQDKYEIEVSGLEDRKKDRITFSFAADTLEDLLRGLLRYIGVKNFAIEFADAALTRIMVVPESVNEFRPTENVVIENSASTESIGVAQVQSIVEFSQAESLDLIAGDIIFEYDGVRISSAQHLVNEVGEKDETSQVEMIILRDKHPIRLILAGGMIGVRVMTKQISKKDIGVID